MGPSNRKEIKQQNDNKQQQILLISSNSISPSIEQFVDKLVPNDIYKLIPEEKKEEKENEMKSDFLPNTNDDELNDKILLNTLKIQNGLKKKHELISSLNRLLEQTKYASTMSDVEALRKGTYHQKYNKSSSNLSAKLQRMESKTKFMGAYSQKLGENVEFKRMETENERLKNELKESQSIIASLESDKTNLAKAVKLKIAKIRQMEEEKGIVIGELRISLEQMSNEQKALNEEKNLLTDNLKEMIEKLSKENHSLRQQISHKKNDHEVSL